MDCSSQNFNTNKNRKKIYRFDWNPKFINSFNKFLSIELFDPHLNSITSDYASKFKFNINQFWTKVKNFKKNKYCQLEQGQHQ